MRRLERETHTHEAKSLNRCVRCGVRMASHRCRCGWWVNECRECQRQDLHEFLEGQKGRVVGELYRRIEDEFFARYKLGTP